MGTPQPDIAASPLDEPVQPDEQPSGESVEIAEQAATLEWLLPACIRQIFAMDPTHPLSELPFGQYRLCILLFREGKRTMSQVSEELSISVSAVTQMADRLEKSGLVERVAEPGGDRRTRFFKLTAYGKSLMESRTQQRLTRATAVLNTLDPEQRRAILDALSTLREASKGLPKHPAPPQPEGGDAS